MLKEGFYFFLFLGIFLLFFFFSVLHESIYISIFFLISLFLISSFLFIMSGIEFVGFLYLIVYVGAVAVLFLFMVMLFDRTEYVIFGRSTVFSFEKLIYSGFLLFLSLAISFFFRVFLGEFDYNDYLVCKGELEISIFEESQIGFSNIENIGSVLYGYFFIGIIGGSVVLLLGMIGSIFLTQAVMSTLFNYKHQDIKSQLLRRNLP